MVARRGMLGVVLLALALSCAFAMDRADGADPAEGYWRRQPAIQPEGDRAKEGVRSGVLYSWALEGRTLRTSMRYQTIPHVSLVGPSEKPKVSTFSVLTAWSLPPERIGPGEAFDIRCSIHARRDTGTQDWYFWLAAWIEGAGMTRRATQQDFQVDAAAGKGNKRRGVLRLRAPEGPEGRGRRFVLVVNGASAGFGVPALPVHYPYQWVEAPPWKADFVDANPRYWDGREPRALRPREVAASTEVRKGAATDGVSQLILRVRKSTSHPAVIRVREGGGTIEPLPYDQWKARDGTVWLFWLYTPRATFGGGPMAKRPKAVFLPAAQPKKRLEKVLEVEDLVLEGREYKEEKDGRRVAIGSVQRIKGLLARPPVVLVHGLNSDPITCWVQTHDAGQSFAAMLERAGMMPFLANYQNSNGTEPDTRPSGFAANSRVVWESPDDYRALSVEQRWYQKDRAPKSWLAEPFRGAPILSDFQRVERIRHGGIRAALAHYRTELELAATQADVIGHSMGGLLARAYAARPDYRRSENFEQGDIHRLVTICTPHFGSELHGVKDALQAAYVKDEPWDAWGRRLLARGVLWRLLEPESGAIRDLRTTLDAHPAEGRRQSALEALGPTPIPAFAITTSIDTNQLGVHPYDTGPEFRYLYTLIGFLFFHNRPLLDDFVTQRAQAWRRAGARQRTTDRAGRPPGPEGVLGLPGGVLDWGDAGKYPVYRGLAGRAIDRAAYYWAMRKEGESREALRRFLEGATVVPHDYLDGGVDWHGTPDQVGRRLAFAALKKQGQTLALGGELTKLERAAREQDIPVEVIGFLRDMIFHGDAENDGAVRTVSQRGGLEKATVHYPGISHFMATWHYKVIRKSIDLLKWEDDRFARGGFPAAGQPMPHWLPSVTFLDDRVHGELAVRWSGMVPAHAAAYGRVADRHDVVVIARPVNHDSTALIAGGAATKGMLVKGKSANWGPQAGFICRDQRFSKLWRVFAADPVERDGQIKKYSAVTETMLREMRYPKTGPKPELAGRPFAVPRALEIPIDGPAYAVLVDPDEPDAEKAIILRRLADQALLSPWNGGGPGRYDPAGRFSLLDLPAEAAARLVPMEVMADGLSDLEPKPYLTADYDLLAIGFQRPGMGARTPPEVRAATFDELLGAITKRQIQIVRALNRSVHATGYEAGDVTHHGPENQYGGSPYVDYPLLVFDPGAPGDGEAEIFLVRQGPVGFRDMHLKRYFTEKIRQGYNLYPNPSKKAGWMWEARRAFSMERGFDPQDASNLPPYVAEQPRPKPAPRPAATPIDPGGDGGDSGEAEGAGSPSPVALRHGPTARFADFAKDFAAVAELSERHAFQSFPEAVAAAKAGDDEAMLRIGYYFGQAESGSGGDRKAILWYRAAADRGNTDAQLNLARRYLAGRGLDKDPVRALDLFRQAAEAGSGAGANGVGWIHYKGYAGKKDYAAAVRWFRLGARRGDDYALSNMGRVYRLGHGVKADRHKAMGYYRRAAEKRHAIAQYRLGRMLQDTRGAEARAARAEAITWLRKAAAQGHAGAMLTLGNSYLQGTGVEADGEKARAWLRKAAAAGSDMAWNNLGAMYMRGMLDTPKDRAKGAAYYHKAAEAGVALGQYNLGKAYQYGWGVKKSAGRARYWYEKAARQGYAPARKRLRN